ncbi:methyltransferase domain-containing protein [Brevundimonas sp. NPDC092305]|uniref:methyltransferase domain-containing protein n=1 Tax=Brevundimonas sp. NPDC092305 TaxID=3363957 RepID=UPI003801579B
MSDVNAARHLAATGDRHAVEGRLEEAFAAYRDSVRAAPELARGYVGAARILIERGDFGQATQVLSRGLAATDGEGAKLIAPPLAGLLAGLAPTTWHRQLDHDLTACLTSPAVDPQTLAKAAARLLLLKTPEGKVPDDDPLWLAFLTRCINVDAAMEARLTTLRRAVLARGQGTGLAEALGQQAASGEYLWPVNDAERQALDALGDDAAVLRAMYEPETGPPVADAGSDVVRQHYEENPYPRWSAPPAPQPRALRSVIEALPGVGAGLLSAPPLSVLVAGCGTGFEPIELARMDPTLTITAMDLSRASISYAEAKASELQVEGVTFMQGDLLNVGTLNRTFDVITSTGVLHHLERPEAGLAALVRVLAPGGVMRLALYSERGRALVKLAHQEIAARGLTPSPDDIRTFRNHVLALPADAPLAALRESDDFYSVSGCRDLLFHAREHRYKPLQLGELLAGAGLRLVGFEATREARTRFVEAFGAGADRLDLALWDRLEQNHPTLFAGMYHLWAQR